MAALAIVWETGRGVVGVGRFTKVRRVATKAVGWRSRETPPYVALATIDLSMCAGQAEVREPVVIKPGVRPLIHRVTALASHRKTRSRVIRLPDAREILLMAEDALRAQAAKGSGGCADVAFGALHCGMCPYQWKAIAVLADLLDRLIPSLNTVAVLTASSELVAMRVRVAVGALDADILEGQTPVTVAAAKALVQAAQWIAGFRIVVELGNRSDGTPPTRRVAILARSVDHAVGVARASRFLSNSSYGKANQ